MKLFRIFIFAVMALLSACSNEDALIPDNNLEIRGINATIGDNISLTRADDTQSISIGRDKFVDNDKIVFTKIERTSNPLDIFKYSNIHYLFSNTSWGRTSNGTSIDPEKIYWSDAKSTHTFIGYCLPQGYSWTQEGSSYSGQLSNTDFTDGNEKMKHEDVLLCYSLNTEAETGGLTAKVNFTHALSYMRVIVNISEYAANSSVIDTKVVVSDMAISNQPIKYTWNAETNSLSGETVTGNDVIKLWCENKAGDNSGQDKTFTFHGLTVPHTGEVPFLFSVKYDSNDTETKTYKGVFSGVEFKSGMCTTLKISLNHRGEKIGMDVSYSDWNYVATPDIGELVKKSTYMNMSIDKVTIHSAENLTADDATWLYIDISDNNKVKDIYGNDGTAEKPYRITSAEQLLSFAKEVNNGNDFGGKTVRLDADITMQKSATATDYSWAGIGTGTAAFNGTFLGGDRYINHLQGKPLFISLGGSARVEQLYITTIGAVNDGALAGTNNGVIGACKVIDETTTTSGALVGTNNGTIYACFHTGAADGVKLVGTNGENAKTVGCYVASEYSAITSTQVDNLNNDLKALYEANTALTQYEYVYSPGNYPTLKKK